MCIRPLSVFLFTIYNKNSTQFLIGSLGASVFLNNPSNVVSSSLQSFGAILLLDQITDLFYSVSLNINAQYYYFVEKFKNNL